MESGGGAGEAAVALDEIRASIPFPPVRCKEEGQCLILLVGPMRLVLRVLFFNSYSRLIR